MTHQKNYQESGHLASIASAEIISSEIIEPLEDVIGAVEGTKHITSKAQTGVAEIKIEFETSKYWLTKKRKRE